MKRKKLFKVENCGHGTFFVVADNETEAATAAEEQWLKWNYFHSEAPVVNITCVAEHHQYPRKGADWLLLPKTSG